MVNVHVFALLPPLEQAPDQITSRVLEALSVIEVPVVNVAEPVLPTVTLIPAGLEVTRSPVRPVAVTVSVAVRLAPPKAPPIVTGVAAVTAVVVIEKLALSAPAVTVTLAGTLATVVVLLDSVTIAPPVGAAVVNVTVPVLAAPPTTLVGLTVTEDKLAGGGGGLTVSTAVREAPPKVPEIVTGVATVTAVVVMEKFALSAPAATVTLAGTLATVALVLDKVTMAPPVGAAAVNVTVPVLPVPPTTLAGLTVTEDKVGAAGTGLTVSTAGRVTPPKVPEIDNAVVAVTLVVVIEKVALVAPAATVTLAGTVATA